MCIKKSRNWYSLIKNGESYYLNFCLCKLVRLWIDINRSKSNTEKKMKNINTVAVSYVMGVDSS